MFGDLFDSPWKILIVAIVIIVLFGSAKLPAAARSLGRSMRILKSEVSSMHDDDDEEAKAGQSPVAAQLAAPAPAPAPVAPVQPVTQPVTQQASDQAWSATTQQVAEQSSHQARIDSLEQQIQELKDSAGHKAAVSADQSRANS